MNYRFLPLCKKYAVYKEVQIKVTKHANLTSNLFSLSLYINSNKKTKIETTTENLEGYYCEIEL